MELFKINPNRSGKVRDTLCIEDIHIDEWDIIAGFGLIIKEEYDGEVVLVFKNPYRVPRFNQFYASRIKSVEDPYLLEVVRRLLYLNPLPDGLLKKKITEYIVLKFSKLEMKPSKVKPTEMIATPVLTFEGVHAVVCQGAIRRGVTEYLPDNEDSVMYLRQSNLSKNFKIKLRAYYRAHMIKDLLESAIHTVTEHLMEHRTEIKVTDTRIEDTKLVTTDNGKSASVRTIRKYMSPRTKRVVALHNEVAPFKSETTQEKYNCFLELDSGVSLEFISESLQISKSTASEFRKYKKLTSELKI